MSNNIIFPSDAVEAITNLIFIETPLTSLMPSDLIIVFGSEFIEGTINELKRIMDKGLFIQTGRVVLSGATGSLNAGKESEAHRMFEEAIRVGLNPDVIIVEDRATNALENIIFSKEKIDEIGGFDQFNSILFLGKAFMLRRAQMSAMAQHYPMNKIQYYGLVDKNGRNIAADSWWKQEESRIRVLQEVERIGKYSAKGDIEIL